MDAVAERACLVDGRPGSTRYWWLRAVLAWLLIALLETLQGIARTLWLAPVVGDLRARQLAIVVALAIIFGVAWLTARWLRAPGATRKLAVGAIWLTLMVSFDVALGRYFGFGWERILADFDPRQGGYLAIAMLPIVIAPWLAARWRGVP
jgi:Kef-type K+ transport system membrane component KefB